ncbi:MAG: hypothetical protein GY869_03500, partial [Planctomycetes bacterium]|nr:hypothetical protein [Planctomycetota bacterium]
ISLTGPGKKSPPTDSSFVRVNIPSFTWQFITFFPDTAQTVYAANKKIILKEVFHFTAFDTLWSFKPPTLPDGFAQLGGIYFNFGNKDLYTPPFLVGLPYDSLPAGVTEDELSLYQFIDGHLNVMYGSYVENGAVWDTVLHRDLAYPFLVLADTAKPVITLTQYSDTITKGADVSTLFDVRDNIANVRWQLVYGPGHENYLYSDRDTLKTCTTSTPVDALIPDRLNVIHETFGVRALLITSDDIHTDTINVSRQVWTPQVGVISIVSHRWIPINATACIDQPGLARVFERSVPEEERPWEYDIYKYRLNRWYNSDSSGSNTWVEFPDVAESAFDFVPGRLIWCKTAEDLRVNFGPGVTPSLKEPCEIVLKPQNWTDLSSPYQFPIMLRDILEATGIAES